MTTRSWARHLNQRLQMEAKLKGEATRPSYCDSQQHRLCTILCRVWNMEHHISFVKFPIMIESNNSTSIAPVLLSLVQEVYLY